MANILVIGAGGAGMNALSDPRLASAGRCVAVNTDMERLERFMMAEKLQIGLKTCGGGPAIIPKRGEEAARESLELLDALLQPELDGLFVIAGLGGGTGTGVLPVLAELAKTRAIPFAAAVALPPLISGTQRADATETLARLSAMDIDVFIVDLEERLTGSDVSLPLILDRANTALVDHVLSRAKALA